MMNIDATLLAAELHRQWVKKFRATGGVTRMKSTTDAHWVGLHGTSLVDIANTDFEELPIDWQHENYQSALVAKRLLDAANTIPDLNDARTRLALGAVIHEAWLQRNPWAKETSLNEPFGNLPRHEQDKDIMVITTAIALLIQCNSSVTTNQ